MKQHWINVFHVTLTLLFQTMQTVFIMIYPNISPTGTYITVPKHTYIFFQFIVFFIHGILLFTVYLFVPRMIEVLWYTIRTMHVWLIYKLYILDSIHSLNIGLQVCCKYMAHELFYQLLYAVRQSHVSLFICIVDDCTQFTMSNIENEESFLEWSFQLHFLYLYLLIIFWECSPLEL